MKDKSIQGVVPPQNKRSIRNIPIPEGRKRVVKKKVVKKTKPVETEEPKAPEVNIHVPDTPPVEPPTITPETLVFDNDDKGGSKKKKIIIGSSTVVVLALVITLVSIFTGATVKVSPKQAEATVNETIVATDLSKNVEGSLLAYKIIELSESKSKTIRATGEEEVETKASGIITVYNNYTEKGQPLVKRTRFETPDGLIYRIDKSVTVPGKSGDTPGSLDIEVFADGTGDEYNTDSENFTIPGFEGQPQFDGFYAETKTGITGGFSGVRKVVSEEDLNQAEVELRQEISTSLSAQVNDQISDDFVVIINESLFTFSNLEQKDSGKSSEVEIVLSGTLNTLVISKKDFSNFLANEALTTFNQSDVVRINNIEELDIILDSESVSDGLDGVTMTISGRANFIWETDADKLKAELAGNNRKELKNILEDFPSISKAEAVIRPFWKRSFPENVDKISVEEVIEDKE